MADRNYSRAFDTNRASPVFNYVWDSTVVITGAGEQAVTGAWRPDTGGGGGGGGSTDMTATNAKLDTLITSSAAILAQEAPNYVTCSVNYTGSLLAKSGAGVVNSIFGFSSGDAQYLRIYDGTSTAGNVISVTAISAVNNFYVDFQKGAIVSSGIFAALSSSPTSHVATGNDAIISIVWK